MAAGVTFRDAKRVMVDGRYAGVLVPFEAYNEVRSWYWRPDMASTDEVEVASGTAKVTAVDAMRALQANFDELFATFCLDYGYIPDYT